MFFETHFISIKMYSGGGGGGDDDDNEPIDLLPERALGEDEIGGTLRRGTHDSSTPLPLSSEAILASLELVDDGIPLHLRSGRQNITKRGVITKYEEILSI